MNKEDQEIHDRLISMWASAVDELIKDEEQQKKHLEAMRALTELYGAKEKSPVAFHYGGFRLGLAVGLSMQERSGSDNT